MKSLLFKFKKNLKFLFVHGWPRFSTPILENDEYIFGMELKVGKHQHDFLLINQRL